MNSVVAALGLLLDLIARVGTISAIVKQAQAEGRTNLTPEEWAKIDAEDAASRQALVDAIAKAKAEGR